MVVFDTHTNTLSCLNNYYFILQQRIIIIVNIVYYTVHIYEYIIECAQIEFKL
jgi:hypothetical protein